MKLLPGHVRCPSFRALLALVMFGLGVTQLAAAGDALQREIGEVKLKDGKVLTRVTFVSVGEASVTGKWDGGRGAIPLAMLPDALRADLVAAAPKPKAVDPNGKPGAPVAPANPGQLPAEIKLNNGFVMRGAKVEGWRVDAMTVDYVGGKVLVKYDDIAPEQRMVFVARKVEMFAARDRAAPAQATRLEGQPQTAGTGEPSAAELQKLIQAGIGARQCVVGMSREQVVQAIGMPDGVQYDNSKPGAAYWLYRRRGKSAEGSPADRVLGFDQGVLQGWKDQ